MFNSAEKSKPVEYDTSCEFSKFPSTKSTNFTGAAVSHRDNVMPTSIGQNLDAAYARAGSVFVI